MVQQSAPAPPVIMTRMVSRRHLNADTRVHVKSSSCGNFGGQNDPRTDSSPRTLVIPSVPFRECSVPLFRSSTIDIVFANWQCRSIKHTIHRLGELWQLSLRLLLCLDGWGGCWGDKIVKQYVEGSEWWEVSYSPQCWRKPKIWFRVHFSTLLASWRDPFRFFFPELRLVINFYMNPYKGWQQRDVEPLLD
jgi:hypothetical protein